MNETQGRCPACYHSEITVFFEVKSVPVFCNILWNSRDEAFAAHRAPIHLAYCHKCGLIFNVAFDSQLMEYSQSYENPLYFSPRFQEYAEDTARHLIQRYQLHDKDIIEIGCGQGYFLEILHRLGNNRAIGFDPSYTPEKALTESEGSAVTILSEAYSEVHAKYPADFICSRHVLEHIDYPLDFLTSIRKTIGKRHDTIVFFEVPNALYTFSDIGIWDIIYEHCSYFTAESLTKLFMRAGFEPINVTENYDGQFLTIEARPGRIDANSVSEYGQILLDIHCSIRKFQNAFFRKVKLWKKTLLRLKKEENRIVVWGAGAKGITFLNLLDVTYNQIEYIVDLNPRKHWKFVPCSGQQVIPPDFIKEYNPQTVIIMNPIYSSEIKEIVQRFELNPEFKLA